MAVHLPLAPTMPAASTEEPTRPHTRGECVDGPRPCPWYACRHHLGLNVDDRGNVVVHEHVTETCALDLVDANPDGMGLEAIAVALDVPSFKAVRDIEQRALSKVPRRSPGLRAHVAEEHRDRRTRSTHVVIDRDDDDLDAQDDGGDTQSASRSSAWSGEPVGSFFDSDAAACALVELILTKRENNRALRTTGPRENDDVDRADEPEPEEPTREADPYREPHEREVYGDD